MKKIILSVGLSLLASNAVANEDPVVSEYQKIDALLKTAPSLAETLILVNSRTAVACDQVSSLDSLIKFDEVVELQNYIRQKSGMDGSDTLVGLIDAATIAVCQSLIGNMLEEPKALSQFQIELSHITSKYSLALLSGVDSETASNQLADDYAVLRSKYLDQYVNAEKREQLTLDHYQSLACDLPSGKVDQKCLDRFSSRAEGLKKGSELVADYLEELACTLPSGEVDQDCMSK